jgi:hypothetical protein
MAKKDKLNFAMSGFISDNAPEETTAQTETQTGGSSPIPEEAPEVKAEAETMIQEPTTAQDETDLINSIENEELREALRKKRMDGRGRPRKNTDKNGKRTDGYSRTSLIVNDELWAKIKEVAFRETLTMKEIVDLALHMVVDRYEAKHGTIKPQPQNYTKNINEIF